MKKLLIPICVCCAVTLNFGCNSATQVGSTDSQQNIEAEKALFPFAKSRKAGMINVKGDIVIPAEYAGTAYLGDGLIYLGKEGKSGPEGTEVTQIVANEKGVKLFSPPVPLPYYDIVKFSEGLIVCEKNDGGVRKYGFFDEKGKLVIKPDFDSANAFSEGLACVKVDDKYGYIDKTGKMVIEPQFDRIILSDHIAPNNNSGFHDGLALVGVGKDENVRWGYIDKLGKFVINPIYICGRIFRRFCSCKTGKRWS